MTAVVKHFSTFPADELKRYKDITIQLLLNEMPLYSCPNCPYKTSKKSNFEAHLRRKEPCSMTGGVKGVTADVTASATEQKPKKEYPCPNCYKVFSRKIYLTDHLERNICEGKGSPHACPVCHKDCETRQKLYYHRKQNKCNNNDTSHDPQPTQNLLEKINHNLETIIQLHQAQSSFVVHNTTHINNHITQNNITLNAFSEIQDDYVIERLVAEFKRRLEQYQPEPFSEDPLIRRVYGIDRFIRDAIRHTFFDPDHTENHTIVQKRPYQKYVSIRERSDNSDKPLSWKHTPRRTAQGRVFSRTADQYKRVQQAAEIHPPDDLYTYRTQSDVAEKTLFQVVEESLLNGSQELLSTILPL
jgi:hypothetical protein